MTELERLEIIRRFQGGASFRAMARALRIDRKTVAAIVHTYKLERVTPHSALPRARRLSYCRRGMWSRRRPDGRTPAHAPGSSW